MNGSSRATHETDWIATVHACGSDHQLGMSLPLPDETWIPIMGDGAGFDAIVAIGTSIHVDDHRLIPIDGSVIDDEIEELPGDIEFVSAHAELFKEEAFGNVGKDQLLDRWSGDHQEISSADAVQAAGSDWRFP